MEIGEIRKPLLADLGTHPIANQNTTTESHAMDSQRRISQLQMLMGAQNGKYLGRVTISLAQRLSPLSEVNQVASIL